MTARSPGRYGIVRGDGPSSPDFPPLSRETARCPRRRAVVAGDSSASAEIDHCLEMVERCQPTTSRCLRSKTALLQVGMVHVATQPNKAKAQGLPWALPPYLQIKPPRPPTTPSSKHLQTFSPSEPRAKNSGPAPQDPQSAAQTSSKNLKAGLPNPVFFHLYAPSPAECSGTLQRCLGCQGRPAMKARRGMIYSATKSFSASAGSIRVRPGTSSKWRSGETMSSTPRFRAVAAWMASRMVRPSVFSKRPRARPRSASVRS